MIFIRTRWSNFQYLFMGPYNAGPKSALFLRVVLMKAGVRGAGVIRAISKREYHVFEKLSYCEIWYIASLVCTLIF